MCASVCCSVIYLMVRSGWGAEWAQGVFTWCGGCLISQSLGLCLSGGCWVGGGPLPLGGACGNVPVVDTGHVCDFLPSWRQVGVCLEWLLTPDIWWRNTHLMGSLIYWEKKCEFVKLTVFLYNYLTNECIHTSLWLCTNKVHSFSSQIIKLVSLR